MDTRVPEEARKPARTCSPLSLLSPSSLLSLCKLRNQRIPRRGGYPTVQPWHIRVDTFRILCTPESKLLGGTAEWSPREMMPLLNMRQLLPPAQEQHLRLSTKVCESLSLLGVKVGTSAPLRESVGADATSAQPGVGRNPAGVFDYGCTARLNGATPAPIGKEREQRRQRCTSDHC